MISLAPIEVSMPESSVSVDSQKSGEGRDPRFSHLRGVQWRISLGILPSSASIEELRRVTADARRRYAGLRSRLLIDPHCPKDGSNSPDLVIDNPLSQNPDSCWGRFFRNAELEKMVDQDLSRLYPEHGSYFQTPACQGMLRRILLLWCLRHPECSYRQGMHELLAPLLYVLHVDAQHLSEVRKLYEDQFIDKFDDMSFPESDLLCNYKSLNWATEIEDESSFQGSSAKVRSLDEMDPEVQTIVLLSDAYGAEGELGILLSERFMEHDAYCMFDALMGGACGAVAMVDYFSPYPATGSHTGLPPVIEASSALYHLLSIVDSSLHSHLVDLGVEPQYFALRWLRVLFGREFLLDDLLIIWDEIFVSDNRKPSSGANNEECGFEIICSPREAFISAMAVSMLLHLRSSLLATEHATSCLQRLLNFPENVFVKKLIEKAKSLKVLALQTNISSPFLSLTGTVEKNNAPSVVRGQSLPSGSISPNTPLNLVPESYWEEKWRVAQKAEEELQKEHTGNRASFRKKGLSEKLKFSLVRTESDPSPAKTESGKKQSRLSVRRRLLEDLARAFGSEEDLEKLGRSEVPVQKDSLSEALQERNSHEESVEENGLEKNFSCVANSICPVSCVADSTCPTGHTGSEENSSIFSASSSPLSTTNVCDNESEKSSVASNLSDDENDDIEHKNKEPFERTSDESPLLLSNLTGCDSQKPELNEHADRKPGSGLKERKLLPGKFPWFWKFGRSANGGTSGKVGVTEAPTSQSMGINQNSSSVSSTADGCGTSSMDMADKNVMVTLKNLGQSMLENIQVIESVFQQDLGQVGSLENLSRNILLGKGQVTAVAALKELRKISNLLSEM